MDPTTLAAYDAAAATFAQDWHGQPAPTDLHALIRRYFTPGRTADIGCGSGREVAWLHANGYPAVGYDPSEGLLGEARARYPDLAFKSAALPELAGDARLDVCYVLDPMLATGGGLVFSGGTKSGSSTRPAACSNACFSTLCSSRILPGQE